VDRWGAVALVYEPVGVAVALPLSAALELGGFVIFFLTVRRHQSAPRQPKEAHRNPAFGWDW